MSCNIKIYDPSFNWVAVTERAESVIFTRNLYGVGKFSIKIHPDKVGAMELAKRDNIIVIDGSKSKSGIIRDFEINGNRNEECLLIHGTTGNGFLSRRTIIPPSGQEFDSMTGQAETVMKYYVDKHVVSPSNSNRRISEIEIAPDKERGVAVNTSLRYTNLEEELSSIAEYSSLGQEIYVDTVNKKWVYDVIEGKDLTTAQSVNSPVLFMAEWQNVSDYRYVENYANYATTAYAGGKGEGVSRLIKTIGNETSGRDRYEIFTDCGAVEGNELTNLGELRLYGFKEAKTIEASALPRVFLFEKDYFLGDFVTINIKRLGITVHTQVTEVTEIWERNSGYRTQIRFGAEIPNIFTTLNKKGAVS